MRSLPHPVTVLALALGVYPACRNLPRSASAGGGEADTAYPLVISPPTAPLTPTQIVDRTHRGIVTITREGGLGTGFVVAAGIVATNLHVVEGASEITVHFREGQQRPAYGVRAFSREHDLALLIVQTGDAPALARGRSDDLAPGEDVVAIGSPLGLEATVSTGVVSAVREVKGVRVVQVTAPISPGSSGGPVIDRYGRVVGVTTFLLREGQNLNFAIAMEHVVELLERDSKALNMKDFAQRSRPEAPPPAEERPAFPKAVAGFDFGMEIDDARARCAQLSGDGKQFTCPTSPQSVPFARPLVTLAFDDGRLVRVTLDGTSFSDMKRALFEKYGKPDAVEGTTASGVTRQGRWEEGRPGRAIWRLEGGQLVVGSVDGADIRVVYTAKSQGSSTQQGY